MLRFLWEHFLHNMRQRQAKILCYLLYHHLCLLWADKLFELLLPAWKKHSPMRKRIAKNYSLQDNVLLSEPTHKTIEIPKFLGFEYYKQTWENKLPSAKTWYIRCSQKIHKYLDMEKIIALRVAPYVIMTYLRFC